MSKWRLAKLSELGEVNRGRSRHRPRDAAHLYGGPYPFVQTGDVKASGGRVTQYSQTYSEEGLAQSRLWPTGTMCITIAANIAETGVLTFPACFPDSVIGFIADSNKADVRFIEYAFRLLKRALQHEATGTVQDNINLQTIERLQIPVPPLAEQRAIAHILGTLDDKIELNRRTNETLEAMARAIFKSWFVDFDPVRAKASGESSESICRRLGLTPEFLALFPDSFRESELGEVPAGWNTSTLAAEAKRYGGFIQTGPFGSQLHASDYVDEGVPVVMPQDLVDRRISVGRIVRVTVEMAQRLSRHAVKPGDVVYSRRGDVERHALVSEREVGWLCGTGCLLVRLGDAWLSQAYLSEVLDLPVTREWLVRHAVGATMPNLNTSILGNVPLLIPSESLLSAFESIAGPLRKQQVAKSIESDSLAAVRDALLPKLLGGELGVCEVDSLGA